MKQFINTATNQIVNIADSVSITETNGVYSFSLLGKTLDWPTTLAPYTPPPPTLTEVQATQISALKASYSKAIQSCPVTIGGTGYTLKLDSANATLNMAAALSAQQALSAPAWTADTAVTVGQLCTIGGVPLFCSTAGTTGGAAPTVPTVIGTPVTDGTATWELFARSAELSNGAYAWFTASEIVNVGQQIELYLHTQKSLLIGLIAEVNAQTAVPTQYVVWS